MSKFSEKVNLVVSSKEKLKTDLFSVYSLRNNEKRYLMDNETNLISSTILDSVSEDISLQFDKLLNIEFA